MLYSADRKGRIGNNPQMHNFNKWVSGFKLINLPLLKVDYAGLTSGKASLSKNRLAFGVIRMAG